MANCDCCVSLTPCRARGIDATSARQALVNSFGAEVTQKLKYKAVTARVQADVSRTLSQVDFGVVVDADEEDQQ